MDIIMVRHGQSQDNLERIFSRDNTRLTPRGKKQIARSRKLLKQFEFDQVYYSPLTRTVESKEILRLDGIREERIREIDFGVFTGKTFDQISEIYPEESKKWLEDPIDFRIPNGESVRDVYSRIEEFIEDIISHDQNVLLVCHDCVIRMVLCWVFDQGDYFFKFQIDNGSINVVSIDEGFKYIKRLNYC